MEVTKRKEVEVILIMLITKEITILEAEEEGRAIKDPSQLNNSTKRKMPANSQKTNQILINIHKIRL